ncbi:MAG: DUF6120 family protein [Clostridiales bacterium]|nr:DUF6120 family protein [Clostridiales bacterium]
MRRSIRQYIRRVKRKFPIMGRSERAYIRQLTVSVESFFEGDDEIAPDMVIRQFGTPENVVRSYISKLDGTAIREKIIYTRRWRVAAVCSLLLLLMIVILCLTYLYRMPGELQHFINIGTGYYLEVIE